MGMHHKICFVFCVLLLLGAGPILGEEKATISTTDIPKAPSAKKEKTTITPPNIANLVCPEVKGISPFLEVTAKAKIGKKYQEVRIGCLDLAESDTLLSEGNQAGLDEASTYIKDSDAFIRVYIDLEDAQVKDQQLLKRFRTKAFAVRKVLTDKGVFTHLKANREGVFPSRFAKKQEAVVKKPVKVVKKAPPKPKPKPRDPLRDYTFHIERNQTFIAKGDLAIYGDSKGNNGFQFIPMQSVYFPHDQYKLTKRAQETLQSMIEYVLANPTTTKLIIQSHTDEVGSNQYNFRLSDRRALKVRDYLIENGLPEEIVEIISLGELQPVDENWTRQGKSRNRRVELYVIQQSAKADLFSN